MSYLRRNLLHRTGMDHEKTQIILNGKKSRFGCASQKPTNWIIKKNANVKSTDCTIFSSNVMWRNKWDFRTSFAVMGKISYKITKTFAIDSLAWLTRNMKSFNSDVENDAFTLIEYFNKFPRGRNWGVKTTSTEGVYQRSKVGRTTPKLTKTSESSSRRAFANLLLWVKGHN